MNKTFNLKDLIEVCTQYEIKKYPLNVGRPDNLRLYGLCCPETRTIYLESRQDHMEMRDTLVHEAIHAHGYITGKYHGMKQSEIEKMTRKETKELMGILYGRK